VNRIPALGEHYHEQALPLRAPQEHVARFTIGVTRVVGDAAEWVTKRRGRFVERDVVLGLIDRSLWTVPRESG